MKGSVVVNKCQLGELTWLVEAAVDGFPVFLTFDHAPTLADIQARVASIPESQSSLLAATASVDLSNLGVTALFNVPTGQRLIVTAVILRDPSASMNPTTPPSLSVGFDSNASNLVANGTYINLGIGQVQQATLASVCPDGSGPSTLAVKVNTASSAVAHTVTVDVLGYFVAV